ncbi:hypothetical protein KCU90_g941, partial [Aureobasidium melanogenum]
MKTDRGVSHTTAFDHTHFIVDTNDAAARDFIETNRHRGRQERTVANAQRNLPREGLGVPFVREHPARQRKLLPGVPCALLELMVHLRGDAAAQIRFVMFAHGNLLVFG